MVRRKLTQPSCKRERCRRTFAGRTNATPTMRRQKCGASVVVRERDRSMSRKLWLHVIGAVVVFSSAAALAAPNAIFWADASALQIERAAITGGTATAVLSTTAWPQGVAVDS